MPQTSHAPIIVAAIGLVSAFAAYVAGWGLFFRAFAGTTHAVEAGEWMLGGAGLALIFDALAIVLGFVAIALRIGKRAPFALPLAIFVIVLGALGLVGVVLLGFGGLVFVAPVH